MSPAFVNDSELVKVGIAEYRIAEPPERLTTIGVGSCVVIALYDTVKRIGGMVHILLPNAGEERYPSNPAKFADRGIGLTLAYMEKQGALRRDIVAKIFGGAQMFLILQNTALMKIGERNIAAVKEELKKLDLKIVAEDIGGNSGRSIVFDLHDGSVRVRSLTGDEKVY
jgi:chemotaxis protein CheD